MRGNEAKKPLLLYQLLHEWRTARSWLLYTEDLAA